MQRRAATLLILALALGACGSDRAVTPVPSVAVATAAPAPPAQTTQPATERPTPRATPSTPRPTASLPTSPAATAIPVTPEAHCRGSDRTPGAPAAAWLSESSSIWAGYIVYRRQTGVSCVEGSWVQPKVTCSKTGRQAVSIWVGIDGVHSGGARVDASRNLVQIGTAAECLNGVLTHHAWHEVLPMEGAEVDIPALAIRPGDTVAALIRYSDGTFTMRIQNVTTNQTHLFTQALANAPRQTAEWVVEAPSLGCLTKCRALPLPRFSPVTFKGAYASVGSYRASISDDKWVHGTVDMTRAGVDRASVSSLRSKGTSFAVTWEHR